MIDVKKFVAFMLIGNIICLAVINPLIDTQTDKYITVDLDGTFTPIDEKKRNVGNDFSIQGESSGGVFGWLADKTGLTAFTYLQEIASFLNTLFFGTIDLFFDMIKNIIPDSTVNTSMTYFAGIVKIITSIFYLAFIVGVFRKSEVF